MYDKVKVTSDDLVIYLGDYIDRGSENVKMLKFMIEESKKPNVITLCGNHEFWLLHSIKNNSLHIDMFNWKTKTELSKESDEFIRSVKDFLRNLDFSYSMQIAGRDFFFCHAGIDPKVSLDEQTGRSLLMGHDDFFDSYDGETMIVVGHTIVQDLGFPAKPVKLSDKNIILMDTGSYDEGGKVSCLDLISKTIWQSD